MIRGLAAWTLTIASATTATPSSAQRRAIDVPAGPLGQSVDRLGQQAGVSIVLTDTAMAVRPAASVRGRMTPEAAVKALARRADVTAERIGVAAWRFSLPRPMTHAVRGSTRARARAAEDVGKDEIVVLASKRETHAAVFAGSVEVIAAPRLGIEAGTQALVTQSTIISSTYRGAGREKLFIRGLSDSSISGRLQSVTGLYFGDVRLTYSAVDPNLQLFDVETVEVLQGPQGTLYGSGSMAGIIRMNPAMPKRDVAEAVGGGGVAQTRGGSPSGDVDAVLNVPVTRDLALRAVGYARREGGFVDRPGTGRNVNRTVLAGGRMAARWWPSEGWTADATIMAQTTRSRDNHYVTIDARPLTVLGGEREPFGSDYVAGHLVVTGRFGAVTMVSATGVALQRLDERFDVGAVFPGSVSDVRRRNALLTHETRFSTRDDGRTSWVAGASYTQAGGKAQSLAENSAGSTTAALMVSDTISETAMFGEGTVRVLPFLSLGGGARAVQATTISRFAAPFPLDLSGPPRRRERWLLPMASILLSPTHSLSGYLRYQEGTRASVPQILAVVGGLEDERGERISAFEAGIRWRSEDGWNAQASVARSHWKQLQVDAFDSVFVSIRGNLGDWRLTSVHTALNGPIVAGLRVSFATTINQAVGGNRATGGTAFRLPDVATVIVLGGTEWTSAIGRSVLRARGWMRYEGRSFGTVIGAPPKRQGDYLRTGIAIDLDRAGNTTELSIENLFDAGGTRYLYGNIARAGTIRTPLQPITARIGYRHRF